MTSSLWHSERLWCYFMDFLSGMRGVRMARCGRSAGIIMGGLEA